MQKKGRSGRIDNWSEVVKVMCDLRVDTSNGKDTHMIGKGIGYGIKTQLAYTVPFTVIAKGKPQLATVFNYTAE